MRTAFGRLWVFLAAPPIRNDDGVIGSPGPIRLERGEGPPGHRWLTATRQIAPELERAIERLAGYDERTPGPSTRPELPGARVVIIVQTETPLRLYRGKAATPATPRAFVAGLGPGATLTAHEGHQQGLQLDLNPSHAREILGLPLSEITGQVVPLDDLLAPHDRGLVDHIVNLSSWETRTQALEDWVRRSLESPSSSDRRIQWAVQAIIQARGAVSIAHLQESVALSRPRFVRLFREQVGVTPKLFARLARFEGLTRQVRLRPSTWADRALELGFSDQAHLTREVRALSGCTPQALAQLLTGEVG